VLERRVAVAPTMGPRLLSVAPQRVSHGEPMTIAVEGLTAGSAFTLAREAADPAGPAGGWPLAVSASPPGSVVLEFPAADLAPGARRIDVVATEAGLAIGRDSIGVTVVPVVTDPTPQIQQGVPKTLATAHAAPDVEVFVGGRRLPAEDVEFLSATDVTVTIAPSTPAGPTDISLRAGKVAGPARPAVIAP
jgi:hypothetical protein